MARAHWQIVWLVAAGRSCPEVAAVTGYGVDWVRGVIHRWNAGGVGALGDRRQANPGAAPLRSAAQQEERRAALAGPAPDGGPWTCCKAAAWIGARAWS